MAILSFLRKSRKSRKNQESNDYPYRLPEKKARPARFGRVALIQGGDDEALHHRSGGVFLAAVLGMHRDDPV